MTSPLAYAPVAAAVFGIPQFLPQLRKLRASRDGAGLSWSWAALTSVSNAAWIAYFAMSRYWTALIPACSATLLAGALAVMLAMGGKANPRSCLVAGAWAAALALTWAIAGRAGLGTVLAAAFAVQVAPSLRAVYATARPTGVSAGTWVLILGELASVLAYGLYESDPRLIALGATGVTASALMLARIFQAGRQPGGRSPAGPQDEVTRRVVVPRARRGPPGSRTWPPAQARRRTR
jgi:hypothetical protein